MYLSDIFQAVRFVGNFIRSVAKVVVFWGNRVGYSS